MSLFANYTWVSMETVETPLDPPLCRTGMGGVFVCPATCDIQRVHGPAAW